MFASGNRHFYRESFIVLGEPVVNELCSTVRRITLIRVDLGIVIYSKNLRLKRKYWDVLLGSIVDDGEIRFPIGSIEKMFPGKEKNMKILVIFLIIPFAASGFVDEDGRREVSASRSSETVEYGGKITLTVLNTFTCPYSAQILGLAYDEGVRTPKLVFASAIDEKAFWCNPDDGTYIWEAPFSSSNASCFGLTCEETVAYTNDFWLSANIFETTDWVNWSTTSNPASNDGRGIDMLDGYVWETYDFDIIRFIPGGSSTAYTPAGIPDQMSGLTAFDYYGTDIIAVTCYDVFNIYFYEFTGSALELLDVVPCPASCTAPYGLEYAPDRGTLFWSYKTGSTHTISELEIGSVGLETSTWGSIKTTVFQ